MKDNRDTPNYPVSYVTHGDRPICVKARQLLVANKENIDKLNIIDSARCIVNIDDYEPSNDTAKSDWMSFYGCPHNRLLYTYITYIFNDQTFIIKL